MVRKYFFGSRYFRCIYPVVSKFFHLQAPPCAKFRSNDRGRILQIAQFLGPWCNFQRIFSHVIHHFGMFFFQWFKSSTPPIRLWSHTPQCPRFVTRPNTSPVVVLRSSSSVKPLVTDNGEAKRRSAKGTKTQSPGWVFQEIFGYDTRWSFTLGMQPACILQVCRFVFGLEEGIGAALKPPHQIPPK